MAMAATRWRDAVLPAEPAMRAWHEGQQTGLLFQAVQAVQAIHYIHNIHCIGEMRPVGENAAVSGARTINRFRSVPEAHQGPRRRQGELGAGGDNGAPRWSVPLQQAIEGIGQRVKEECLRVRGRHAVRRAPRYDGDYTQFPRFEIEGPVDRIHTL